MRCALCALRRGMDRVAAFVIFGLSVCGKCGSKLTDALVEGASVRDVLARAREGNW